MFFAFQDAVVPALHREVVKQYELVLKEQAIQVPIIEHPNCFKNCCHLNVENLVKEFGGKCIRGYYIVTDSLFKESIGIYHSIWYYNTQYIDPTPFEEGIMYHTFIPKERVNNEGFLRI